MYARHGSYAIYSWLDKYDARGENRRIGRLAEKENKKFRDAAKKERNELVRSLVKFVKKRDKRVQSFNKELAEKTALNAQKTAEMRQRSGSLAIKNQYPTREVTLFDQSFSELQRVSVCSKVSRVFKKMFDIVFQYF